MISPDIFEAYLNISLPKDIAFLSSFKFPLKNNSTYLEGLAQYQTVKQRVDDFSSDDELIDIYSENPLNFIRSELLKKEVYLRESFDVSLSKIVKSVDDYSGSHPRKFEEVNSDLQFLSVVYAFTGSNVNFNKVKKSIYSTLNEKINSTENSSDKNSFKYFLLSKSPIKNLVNAAILVGGIYLGHSLFPKEKQVYTTIDKSIYENSAVSLERKLDQFVSDRNSLSIYESKIFQDLINENSELKGDLNGK